ncbi:4425_t:CDS:2 [Gigaspora margarita]|uniref:4425_t:CDS:1 n=1 Tax=Gigaspora margarita TaxID=4874 RepID=A0ABM8VVJ9_GIGMA|nr:4425_t:CDS:2 [Gigaspora margarita]
MSSVTATENLVIKNTVNNISEISNVSTSEMDNVSENNEMEPLFVWDESAFEKAKMLADKKECNYDDEIEWEDLSYKSSETASLTIQSTESLNYLLEAQLIGTWEIDGEAFKSVKTDQLYTLGGHLFRRQGSGNQPFSLTSDNSEQKELLLTYLNSTLSFFDKTKSYTSDPPSLLYIKIALRLGQVNFTKIMENDLDLTPKNKEILENPNSLAEYQSAFPAYSEQLKLQISSAQSERDRIQTLLSEYIGDVVTLNKDRNAQSRKEAIWKLAEDLMSAFQLPDPTAHELFTNTMEINETGFSLISSCRRRHDVNIYKLSTLLSNNGKGKKRKCMDSVISKPITDNNNESEKNPPKRIRRSTSNSAKEILTQLLTCRSFSDDDQLLYKELQDVDPGWTNERVITYWRNQKNK